MDRPIDISLTVSPNLPRWPESPPVSFERRLDLELGDVATDTTLRCSVHTGTHVDAPAHFVRGGRSVDAIPLEVLVGPAMVINVGEVDAVGPDVLERAALPKNIRRLLIKTRNSRWWDRDVSEFRTDFVALTEPAAQWLVDNDVLLVGIDYLSIQRFNDGPGTHQTLLAAEIVIVEGLQLGHVTPGMYRFCCLPLKLHGVEGAPARAVLWPLVPQDE